MPDRAQPIWWLMAQGAVLAYLYGPDARDVFFTDLRKVLGEFIARTRR